MKVSRKPSLASLALMSACLILLSACSNHPSVLVVKEKELVTVPLELLPVPNQNLEASDVTYSDSLTLNNVLRGELRRIANELEVYKDEVRNAEQKLKEFNEEQKKKAEAAN